MTEILIIRGFFFNFPIHQLNSRHLDFGCFFFRFYNHPFMAYL
uniref:Uncharacterized protein n=1 Tax=Picea sitchensis TaxID=3332 RepID=D5AC65_PICSI|nr:unknown [Picea sitchensis]